MTGASLLVAATLLLPAALLLALLLPAVQARSLQLLAPAPLPGLAAALLARDAPPLVFDAYGLRLSLALDDAGGLLLGATALLWSAAGLYASSSLREDRHALRFAACWLLTMAGSLGCFLTADLLTFYLAFALVSIPAYGMIIHDGTAQAWRAGAVTLSLAIGGEVCLLLGFALMANAVPTDSLAISDAVAALPASPRRQLVLALLLAGFGLKAGLVPLHVWLPLAHPAAPMPASAVLSGAIIKAGIIGLIRFLPFPGAGQDPGVTWGLRLGTIGFTSAFYAVLVGVTQRNPKAVLAYSSISQMGLVCAALGLGLAAGDPATPWAAASYAAHHVLAKGALFLAVGLAARGCRQPIWFLLLPASILAAGFGGLPLTGGYIAKLAVKDQLGSGLAGMLSVLSAIGSTTLMLHFIRRLMAISARNGSGRADPRELVAWLATAGASILVPWLLVLTGRGPAPATALAASSLWPALWPVLAGGLLALLLARFEPMLPAIPEGDLVGIGERWARSAGLLMAPIARAEARLRHWPAAGTAMLVITVVLGGALLWVRS